MLTGGVAKDNNGHPRLCPAAVRFGTPVIVR
jgi:hypothetical protein